MKPGSNAGAVRVAIACGGTGGHLFPGLAVAEQLAARGCAVTLLVSPKEVDQQGARQAAGMQVVTLPAVGLQRGSRLAFVWGFARSYRAARALFRSASPHAALAMGGFTSAPPILAARRCGARTFLHESNSIPGRANRWLSWIVHHAFVGFPETAPRLHSRRVVPTGTPVRPQFHPRPAVECRAELGLDPGLPVILVTGGSQGARGLNELVLRSRAHWALVAPQWQWLHLAGAADAEAVRQAYATTGLHAQVHAFLERMDLALGAASAVVSRAGASSLAELAAMRVPALLVPFPAATDNHQFHNAAAFVRTGAARMLDQQTAVPESFETVLTSLVRDPEVRRQMQDALAQWHRPRAAQEIAESILGSLATAPSPQARPAAADSQESAKPESRDCSCVAHGAGCAPEASSLA